MVIEEGKLIRGFECLDVGDRVRVELIRTDVEQGFIDFDRAGKGQGGRRRIICKCPEKYQCRGFHLLIREYSRSPELMITNRKWEHKDHVAW